jgi:pyruvate formate lyase activating enzyme
MTFSTYSCNLQCPWCQNWHLSRKPPPETYNPVNPSEIVDAALKSGDLSICASFNEPTLLFEYLLDLFPIAKKKGLLCTMVSNGYMTPKALKMLADEGLDAINMDIKGDFKACGLKNEKVVWQNAKFAVKIGLHLEIVNLIVTGVNDSEDAINEVIEKHIRYAGKKIPIHFTRYFPAFMFDKPPTRIEVLERAVEVARKNDIEFAYIGNVSGHKYENTYCPQCNELLIQRTGYKIAKNLIRDGKCCNCGKEIYGVW